MNIFLDLFLNREGFAEAAEKLLMWCEEDLISGSTSAINIANIYSILGQQKSKQETRKIVKTILEVVAIPNTSRKDLLLAIDSSFSDFEEAIQFFTALNVDGINYIITRNKKDFKYATIPVVTPAEFVQLFQ
jgi:predicted nucleic acid-binding protein